MSARDQSRSLRSASPSVCSRQNPPYETSFGNGRFVPLLIVQIRPRVVEGTSAFRVYSCGAKRRLCWRLRTVWCWSSFRTSCRTAMGERMTGIVNGLADSKRPQCRREQPRRATCGPEPGAKPSAPVRASAAESRLAMALGLAIEARHPPLEQPPHTSVAPPSEPPPVGV